jgi:hypothetical protein
MEGNSRSTAVHAVGLRHPRAAAKGLPVVDCWIGVAAEMLALLQSGSSFLRDDNVLVQVQ